MVISEIDIIAYGIFTKNKDEDFLIVYPIDIFIEEHILFDNWYSEYYDKAKIELRKFKIQKINEKSINSSRCAE